MTTRESKMVYSAPGAEETKARVISLTEALERQRAKSASLAPVLAKQAADTGVLGSVAQSASAKITSLTNSIGPLGAGLGAVSRAAPEVARGLLQMVAAQERVGLLQRTVNVAVLGGVSAMLAGGVAIAAYADDALRAADSYATLHARIRTFSDGAIGAAETENKLYATAKNARTSIGDLTTLYTRLAPAVKDYGKNAEDALTITQLTSKALAIQGADIREQAAATVQFSQSIASGVLRGDELRSLLETSPQLLRYIAQNLEINGKVGVAFSQLRNLGNAGALSTEKIINALLKAQPAIERDFINAPKTAQQGWVVLKDQITRTVGTLDATVGGQQAVVKWLGDMAVAAEAWRKNMLLDPKAFNSVRDVSRFVGEAVGSIASLGKVAVDNFDAVVHAGEAILALKVGSVIAGWFAQASVASRQAITDLVAYQDRARFEVGSKLNPIAGQVATAARSSSIAADQVATEKATAAQVAAARATVIRTAADTAQAKAEDLRRAAATASAQAEAALAKVERDAGRDIAAAQRLKGEAAEIRATLEEDAARRSAAAAASSDAAAASKNLSNAGIGTAGTYYAKLAQEDAKAAMLLTDEQRAQQLARLEEIQAAELRSSNVTVAAEQRKSAAVVAADAEMTAASKLVVQSKVAEAESAALVGAADRAEAQAKAATVAATNSSAVASTRNTIAQEAEAVVTAEVTTAMLAKNAVMKVGMGLYSLLGGAIGVATLAIGGLIYAVLQAQEAERKHYEAMKDSVDITDRLKVATDAMAAATWAEIPGIMAKTKALRDQAAAQREANAQELTKTKAQLEQVKSEIPKAGSAEAAEGLIYQAAQLEKKSVALGGLVSSARMQAASDAQSAYREQIIFAAKTKSLANEQLNRGTDAAGRPLTDDARDKLKATVSTQTAYLQQQVDKLDGDLKIVDAKIADAKTPTKDKVGLGSLRADLGGMLAAASEGVLSGAASTYVPPTTKPKKVPGNAGVSAAYTDLLKSGFLNLTGGGGYAASDGAVTLNGRAVKARSEDEATALAKYVKVVESLNNATDAQVKKAADQLGVQVKSRAELKLAAGAVLAHELATSKASQADDKWADIKAEMDGSSRAEIKAQRELNTLIEDGASITDEAKTAYLAWIKAKEAAAKLQRGLQTAQPLVQKGFDLALAGEVRPTLANGVIDEKAATEQLMAAKAAVILDRDRAVRDEIERRVQAGELLEQDRAKATTDATAAYAVAVEISTQDQLLEIRKARLQESKAAQEQQIAETSDAIINTIKGIEEGDSLKSVGKNLANTILQSIYEELLYSPIRKAIQDTLRSLMNANGGASGSGLFKSLSNAVAGAFGKADLNTTVSNSIAANPNLFADGRVPGYANGNVGRMDGIIVRGKGGPRGDENIVKVSPDESIINATSTRKYHTILDLINRGVYRPGEDFQSAAAYADGYLPISPVNAIPNIPPTRSGGGGGDVYVNNYGDTMKVDKRRDQQGNTHIDLRPLLREGVRDAARNGDVTAGLKQQRGHTRRG